MGQGMRNMGGGVLGMAGRGYEEWIQGEMEYEGKAGMGNRGGKVSQKESGKREEE